MVLVFYCLRPVSHSGLPQDESHVQNYSTPVQNTSLLRTNHMFKIIPHQFKTQVFSGRITRSKLFHTSSKHKSSQDESRVQNDSTLVQNIYDLCFELMWKIFERVIRSEVTPSGWLDVDSKIPVPSQVKVGSQFWTKQSTANETRVKNVINKYISICIFHLSNYNWQKYHIVLASPPPPFQPLPLPAICTVWTQLSRKTCCCFLFVCF